MRNKALKLIITVSLLMGIGSVAQGKDFNNINNVKVNNILEVQQDSVLERSVQTGKVINVSSNLRIRTAPNTTSSIVGYLFGGDYVRILSKSGNWYEIEGRGLKGYVSGEYISIVGDNTVVDGENGQVTNVSTTLRLRISPSTSSEVIGTLRNGDRFKILEKSGSWYKIDVGSQVGYVHGDYVKVLNGSQGGDTSKPENKPESNVKICDGKVINVNSSLRMRSDATTSASVVGTLYPGNTFEIYGQKNGWYYIKFNGKFGYVYGDYVKKLDGNQDGETSKPESNVKICDGKVTNVDSSLRMRSDASTSASVVGTLYPGNTFEIYGQKNGWYYIKFNGKFGYVHGDYVKKLDGNTDNSDSNINQSKYEIVVNEMKKFLGTPYVYGGSGEIISDSLISSLQSKFPGQQYNVPSQYRNGNYRAFDCSGLMQWGFKKAGISLGRTTYDQVKAGRAVSKNDVQPGDLIFYSDLNHVGMYVGNGQWIESPRTGVSIRIADVPWSKIGQIRRVL